MWRSLLTYFKNTYLIIMSIIKTRLLGAALLIAIGLVAFSFSTFFQQAQAKPAVRCDGNPENCCTLGSPLGNLEFPGDDLVFYDDGEPSD